MVGVTDTAGSGECDPVVSVTFYLATVSLDLSVPIRHLQVKPRCGYS
jgi:hypothetical protein